MDKVLNGLHESAVTYLDDIFLHNTLWENHLEYLSIVFQKLKGAGLRSSKGSAHSIVAVAFTWDFIVVSGEVKPMDCKVYAVRNSIQPKTKKDVHSFLRILGYYRKFISKFTTVATPLSDLTRKSMPKNVNLHSSHVQAFNNLTELLTQPTILVTSNLDLTFVLQSDAPAYGLTLFLVGHLALMCPHILH